VPQFARAAPWLLLAFAVAAHGQLSQERLGTVKGDHLTADDTIQDLLGHPAFAGFAPLLLPWDDRTYENGMRLRVVGSLLPYHSHVDPAIVVGALNHMIDDVSNGKTVFYDFYTQGEKAEEPAKAHTGLFFFRGKPGAPFAVVSPGGGFSYVGSVHEGFPYAVAISKQGYNAFVLKYRAGAGGTVATRDLAAALSYIFRNADRLGVGTEAYSLWGSSAGARMGRPSARTGQRALVAMTFPGHRPWSWPTPAIRKSPITNRPPLPSSASAMASLLQRSWKGASRRCAGPAPRWSSFVTAISVMASVLGLVPVRKDGSTAPFGSGSSPSDRRPGAKRQERREA